MPSSSKQKGSRSVRTTTSTKSKPAKTSTVTKKQTRNKPSYKAIAEQRRQENEELLEKNVALKQEARQEREAAQQANARGKTAFDVLSKVEIKYALAKNAILILAALLILTNVIWAFTR